MIEGGAIAAVAITFAQYALRLWGGSAGAAGKGLAIAAIALVAAVNYVGVKPGSRVLNCFVVLKLIPLGLLIGAGLLFSGSEPAGGAAVAAGSGTEPLLLAFGAALIPVMFSYGGWQNANYVTEEMRDPARDLPASLLLGTRRRGPGLRGGELGLPPDPGTRGGSRPRARRPPMPRGSCSAPRATS